MTICMLICWFVFDLCITNLNLYLNLEFENVHFNWIQRSFAKALKSLGNGLEIPRIENKVLKSLWKGLDFEKTFETFEKSQKNE